MGNVATPGGFKKTITLGVADVSQQLSALMIAAQTGAWIHGMELSIVGYATNTGLVYIGDSAMATGGVGVAPASFFWALDGDGNPYNSGGGRGNNNVHAGDYWLMSTVANQKIRVEFQVA